MSQIKQTIEALLFTSSDPVSLRKIKEIVENIQPITNEELQQQIAELKQEYIDQGRAFRLDEIAKGYILRTCEEFSPYIQQLHNGSRKDRLSHATLEVLAIIAYKQPITRTQIDEIRGVDSSGVVYTLLERQLIESVGKLEVPGRPTLFGVTNDFMKHFGLRDLKELPTI
jgi:segregation and condensation protein B